MTLVQKEIKKIYLGTTQVRPSSGGRKPGANTLLYLPLNSTYTSTDQSGNNVSTTNTNVTFGTYAGVDCGQFGNGRHIQVNTLFQQPANQTVLCWCYNTGVYPSTRDGKIYDARNSTIWYLVSYGVEGGRGYGYQFYMNGIDVYPSGNWNYQYQWILMAIVSNATSITRYVKNATYDLSQSNNASKQAFTPTYINIGNEYNNGAQRYFVGGLSELIVEGKAWTAQEIDDYYNLTKSKYGIS